MAKSKPNSVGWYWMFFAGVLHSTLIVVIFVVTMNLLLKDSEPLAFLGFPILLVFGTTALGHWWYLKLRCEQLAAKGVDMSLPKRLMRYIEKFLDAMSFAY